MAVKTTKIRITVVLLPLLFSFVWLDCTNPPVEKITYQVEERPSASPEEIVATVNGIPILASDLLIQMQAENDSRAALEVLIKHELLAQEARKRGYAKDLAALDMERRAMANLIIRREFGDQFKPENVADHWIEKAYENNKTKFVHPDLVEVVHLLAKVLPHQSKKLHERAEELAQKAHAIAVSRPLTPDEFAQIRDLLAKEAVGIKFKAQTFFTDETTVVRPFAEAAFALKEPGDISPVVKTRYGYHVIYLKRKIPSRNTPLSEVKEEIRAKIFEEVRAEEFKLYLDELEKRIGVSVNPGALDPSKPE
ncbi:MAG: peptidyl-prolyl cis-trans isomerase [Pseudomonadota bacterium]